MIEDLDSGMSRLLGALHQGNLDAEAIQLRCCSRFLVAPNVRFLKALIETV